LESFEVEYLATLRWRWRRFVQAEGAEIWERREFAERDFARKLRAEARDRSLEVSFSARLLKYTNNSLLVREAKETLAALCATVTTTGFMEPQFLKKLYGRNQDQGLAHKWTAAVARQADKSSNKSADAELRKEMAALLDAEIERLEGLEKALEADEMHGYETHLSREIDKAPKRLERLQRTRQVQRCRAGSKLTSPDAICFLTARLRSLKYINIWLMEEERGKAQQFDLPRYYLSSDIKASTEMIFAKRTHMCICSFNELSFF
jgi:hypothetical protein